MSLRSSIAAWRRGRALARARTRREVFCAIATRDFLPWALVLFDSLRRHHPDAARVLLFVRREGEAWSVPVIDGVEVLTPAELVGADIEAALRRRFTIPEFCFSLKPGLLRNVLGRLGERAYYLDTDIDVVAPLEEAAIALESSPFVLTPHLDAPVPLDGKSLSELAILRAGSFNLGFAGVAHAPEVQPLLDWWTGRVMTWGYVSPEFGYQGDQKWMDLAPSLFPFVCLLRDPGSNLAYWNLHSRRVARREGILVANDRPVSFIHFSGFDPDRPEVLSKFQNRIAEADQPALMELARDFARRIVAARPRAQGLAWKDLEHSPVEAAGPVTAQEAALPDDAFRARLETTFFQTPVETFERGEVTLVVRNESPRHWPVGKRGDGTGAIAVSFHILKDDGQPYRWDNERFFLPRDLAPGDSLQMQIGVRAPPEPGRYYIEFDLVRDGDAWFGTRGSATATHELLVGRF